jgi:hypothetical protein
MIKRGGNIVNYIPGFRSKTKWKMIVASIYYALSLISISQGIGNFLAMVAAPFVVFAFIDMIKRREKQAIATFAVAFVVFIIGATMIKQPVQETKTTDTPKTNAVANTKTNNAKNNTREDNATTNNVTTKAENKTKETVSSTITQDNSSGNLTRKVIGVATDLGTGTFTVGNDIKAGTYDVTTAAGQGNFIVNSNDGTLITNEVLGSSNGIGVNKVRVVLSDGWQIKISNLNKVHFEPVTNNSTSNKRQITLYSGYWLVGLDVAPGRYIAGNNLSDSSNFIVYDSWGTPKVNEIISNSNNIGVKEVTIDLNKGDIINISGSNGITLTPQ